MYTSYLLMLGMKLIQYNTMTKFKQNQNDIYELNLKIHDETKAQLHLEYTSFTILGNR